MRVIERTLSDAPTQPSPVSTSPALSTSSAQSSSSGTSVTASPPSLTPSAASSPSPTLSVASTQSVAPIQSVASSQHSKSSNSLSAGAVAGAAVGGLAVGGLVALVLCFYFFRRQRTRGMTRGTSEAQKSPPAFTSDKKTLPIAVAPPQRTIDNDLDSLLPQEADDNTVRRKASTLFDQFELHVENYYQDVKVSIPPAMESELSRFSSPHLSEPLVAFLNSTSRPMTLLKHSLAFHVMSLTSATGENARSLLPQELVGMVRTVNLRKPTAGLLHIMSHLVLPN